MTDENPEARMTEDVLLTEANAQQAPALDTFPPSNQARTWTDNELKEAVAEVRSQMGDDLLRSKEKMLRVAADFENFRKRAKRDQDDAVHNARVEVLKEILPVFDNLARAVEHGENVQDIRPILDGAKMVTRQFEENLARFGLKRIRSVGDVFDPMLHEAIAQEETTEAQPGTIIREFLAGYMLGDRLLRAAMVVVARKPAEAV